MKAASIRTSIVAVAALACLGCSSKNLVTQPVPPTRPVPVSPDSAVRMFEWGWNHLDLPASCDWLAGDFRFVPTPGDSAGNLFRDLPIERLDLAVTLHHLYNGGGLEPRADSIRLRLDPTLRVLPDSRPGEDEKVHKEIPTGYDLTVWTAAGTYHIVGDTRFFVVRGDAALLPPAMGLSPDSTRWYLEQWNDETVVIEGAPNLIQVPPPQHPVTWGQLLELYRD